MNEPVPHFLDHLQRLLIGPGGDTFGLDPATEFLTDFPLNQYYSGILYPERARPAPAENSFIETDAPLGAYEGNGTVSEPEEMQEESEESTTSNAPETDELRPTSEASAENASRDVTEVNRFFPAHMGLQFCVEASATAVRVRFSAGRYNLVPNFNERRIAASENEFSALKNHPDFPYAAQLRYENEAMFLEGMEAKLTHKVLRGALAVFRKIPGAEEGLKTFEKLTEATVCQREPLNEEQEIPLVDGFKSVVFGEKIARCDVRCLLRDGKKYVKLLLVNAAEPQAANAFSAQKLGKKVLFQVEMRVETPHLQPYRDHLARHPFDAESSTLDYQYRDLPAYGIGSGCAVAWEKEDLKKGQHPGWVETTFLPQADIPAVSQGLRAGQEEATVRLRNLSIWSAWSQDETADRLASFVNAYAVWVERQATDAAAETEPSCREIARTLVAGQQTCLTRMRAGVDLLRQNKDVFDCFRFASTAMYLQMVISRDERFGAKEKEWPEIKPTVEATPELYRSLDTFKNYDESRPEKAPPAYRPFQLAFFLLSLPGLVNEKDADRTGTVDLLWFPTGGGKTEAYLALTAFVILWRRRQFPQQSGGVSVIMRYTLRLLTAQQFERASRLIAALDFLRKTLPESGLGSEPVTIGMWVGGSSTPNKLADAVASIGGETGNDHKTITYQLNELNRRDPIPDSADAAYEQSPFQISACPWCGCKLITKNEKGTFSKGFFANNQRFTLKCRNLKCEFKEGIPLDVVDESLYQQPPTLLFGTVDKFAQLAHRAEGHQFFDSIQRQRLPPDLIIQDELHLLNGPLGSVVGLFELLIEKLCSHSDRVPKYVASTATTRNTAEQVSRLYGGRAVGVFPPPGLRYDDSFFSVIDRSKSFRKHVGFLPTGKTSLDTHVKALLPTVLLARIKLLQENNLDATDTNPYWTVVSYYNSLRHVGRAYNKINDEVKTALRRLQDLRGLPPALDFNWKDLFAQTRELTSRVDSAKIKATLKELESPLTTARDASNNLRADDTVGLVLASNMFSVGIDIGRLNLMLMNGQPKSSAEYIQASSRVARNGPGLVLNLLDPNLAREKSYFENYPAFHQAYYRFVEPLTVTPFTEVTLGKVLNALVVTYVRQWQGRNAEKQARDFDGNLTELRAWVLARIPNDLTDVRKFAEKLLDELSADWKQKAGSAKNDNRELWYRHETPPGLIRLTTEADTPWNLMQSMREVDTECVYEIQVPIAPVRVKYAVPDADFATETDQTD